MSEKRINKAINKINPEIRIRCVGNEIDVKIQL